MSPDTVRFFLSLDMKLLEMITSTETSAFMQITNQMGPGNFRVGKVGRVYEEQQECKIFDKNSEGNNVTNLSSLYLLQKCKCV